MKTFMNTALAALFAITLALPITAANAASDGKVVNFDFHDTEYDNLYDGD